MDKPEQQIEASDAAMWASVLAAIRSSRRWQFWIKVLLILGGSLVGAVGGGMEGPLRGASAEWSVALKGLLVVGGGGLAFAGGALLLFVDDDVPHVLEKARALSAEARTFLTQRDALAERLEKAVRSADQLDRKRRERLASMELMLEVVEAALLSEASVSNAAQAMLTRSIHAIRKAVDYEGEDFFTVSIFKREDRGGGEQLHRIAAEWSDPQRAAEGGRSWHKGQGYSGVAWARAVDNAGAEVVEPDTTEPHIAIEYPIPNRDPTREALYLSVAAIPILIREDDEVWGVVTATSDRRAMFRRDPSALGIQNVQVIRDIARIAALLAGIERRTKPPPKIEPRVGWFGRS